LFYRDKAGTIWDSFYDATLQTWNLQQINAGGLTNGPAAVSGPSASVFLRQQQHVVYRDAAGTIWDSFYDASLGAWNLRQINAGGLTNGPAAIGDPSASVFLGQWHVVYRDTAGIIWESFYDASLGRWKLRQINSGS
jgi:hypothetical protein